MAVALHDLVGLLQATMGIYYAFHDRVPMLVLGGSGPADTGTPAPGDRLVPQCQCAGERGPRLCEMG